MIKDRKNILIAIVGMLLLLVFVLYLARGWVRGAVVPSVSSTLYAGKVDAVFSRKIEHVNNELAKYGIKPSDSDHADKGKTQCFDGKFNYIREKVICGRWVS